MTKIPESFQEHKGLQIKEIDASKVLSRWYGPDSIACHKLKIYQDGTAESEFTVGQNLCAPVSRPPMFDRLKLQDGVFTTQTSTPDAKQHFIESVGIQVIPGHNIMGLTTEALKQEFYQDREEKGRLYVVVFDFMRFKGLILPNQEISFTASTSKNDTGITGSVNMKGERRPFTGNFRCEEGELDEELQKRTLDQHWIFEINAQGLGVMALQQAPKDVIPVLMESGPSFFAKIPILAGDTVTSRFTIKAADEKQVFGDAKTFIKNQQIAQQEDLLLQLIPLESLKEAVEAAKHKTSS